MVTTVTDLVVELADGLRSLPYDIYATEIKRQFSLVLELYRDDMTSEAHRLAEETLTRTQEMAVDEVFAEFDNRWDEMQRDWIPVSDAPLGRVFYAFHKLAAQSHRPGSYDAADYLPLALDYNKQALSSNSSYFDKFVETPADDRRPEIQLLRRFIADVGELANQETVDRS
jgi:hypothetical protein